MLTTAFVTASAGILTEVSTTFRHSLAWRLNPAPGHHAGTYFTFTRRARVYQSGGDRNQSQHVRMGRKSTKNVPVLFATVAIYTAFCAAAVYGSSFGSARKP